MSDDPETILRQLSRIEAWALLHGVDDSTEAEIERLCRALDAVDEGAGQDWQRERDQRLGRALGPP